GARSADGSEIKFGEMGYVVALEDAAIWAHGIELVRPHVTEHEESTGWQIRTVIVPCTVTLAPESKSIMNVILARGVSQDEAYQRWEDGVEEIALAEAEHRADDEKFWERAPQLSGDWPEHWRRGLVYDLETLRMVMRPSTGVVSNTFDGMQIQAPRLVLAEAALDALFLSYADPELASEVILTHFESAPHPHLPCMREDGSYNMVADDGQICGTAPEWGYPLWCCQQLWLRSGNLSWLQRLYPGAAAYLRWWLDHRRDAEGWEIYECSWESGQDVSSRFGPQQTGGTIIQHVRPVDLQASMAQGAEILAHWAKLLGQEQTAMTAIEPPIDFAAEAAWWQQIANEFTVKTRLMWQHGWFRDYDAVTSEWSEQQDAMHLAPVFCGVAGWGQIEQLRPFLAQPPMHSSGWAPLSWPPVVMTLVGAADVAQMPLEAAELAYRFIDASYRSTDRRELDEQGGLPGVTREYHATVARGKWGAFDYANAGIEGYGWGALSIHLLMRYILGLRAEDVDRLTVRPVLPQALCRLGATYQAEPIPWGGYTLRIACTVKDVQRYRLHLHCTVPATGAKVDGVQQSATQQETQEYQCEWEGRWGEERTLQLPHLTIVTI